MKNASLTSKSSSLANGWPMIWHRGRCPINWYQDQRSDVWYLKKPYKIQVVSTSGVIPTIKWCPSKIQDSSLNHLPQMQTFASMRSTPFMEIDDKGGEIVQRYESFGRDWDKLVEVGHGHGQRGSNIEEKRWIKILGQEKHTSRGSKLINFDWLHLICA